MAEPPNIASLRMEDLQGEQALARAFVGLAQGTMDNLAAGLTFRQNFAGKRYVFEVAVPDDWQRPMLAAGATASDAAKPPLWRKTYSGEVEGIGVVQPAGVPGELYTLPWVPIQPINFASENAGVLVTLRIEANGLVRQTNGPPGADVNFRFAPTDRSPWAPAVWPKHFAVRRGEVVSRVMVENAKDKDGGAPCHGPLEVLWTQVGAQLVVNNIVGLCPGRTYVITLFIFL